PRLALVSGAPLSSALNPLSSRTRKQRGGSDVAKFCCFQYTHKIPPWRWVSNYEFTRNSCSQQAVIFTTKRGQKLCATLKEAWVQKYMSLLRARQQP
uniref:C-C motif chemokine ligand 26 n=1 Tax=Monodon monoceros TaxID=40151 RepID=A0A8C6B3G3_MONMO